MKGAWPSRGFTPSAPATERFLKQPAWSPIGEPRRRHSETGPLAFAGTTQIEDWSKCRKRRDELLFATTDRAGQVTFGEGLPANPIVLVLAIDPGRNRGGGRGRGREETQNFQASVISGFSCSTESLRLRPALAVYRDEELARGERGRQEEDFEVLIACRADLSRRSVMTTEARRWTAVILDRNSQICFHKIIGTGEVMNNSARRRARALFQ